MNILSVNKFYWRKGGSESVFFGEKKLLEEHGHSVVPFSMKNPHNLHSDYDRYFADSVDFEINGLLGKVSAACKVLYSFDSRNKIKQLLDEIVPDIAHFHIFQHQISPSVFGPIKKRKIPLILTLHDLKPICPNYKMLTHDGICERCKGRKFYNCLLHKCTKESRLNSLVNSIEMYFHYAMGYYQGVDKYIAVSRFYRDKMIEFGFPSKQVVHIPNFIDLSLYQPSGEDDGYGLYFGRLSEEKGCITLLQALAITPDIPFLFIGSGPQEEMLQEKARELDLVNVKFLGFKSGEELKSLVANASFVVIPSEWYENCPMSVLESFALEKPVIGAHIGGIPELIEDGEDGLTFESGNVDSLAQKIDELWKDPSRRAKMGKTGRLKIQRNYNPESHYEQLMDVYQSVLK